jgi:hypothetical protein
MTRGRPAVRPRHHLGPRSNDGGRHRGAGPFAQVGLRLHGHDPLQLEPVDRVQITILMDNVTEPLLIDHGAIARMNWPKAILGGLPTASARASPDTGVPDTLLAEPGFPALVRIEKGRRTRRYSSHPGVSPNGMVENMRRLGVNPGGMR